LSNTFHFLASPVMRDRDRWKLTSPYEMKTTLPRASGGNGWISRGSYCGHDRGDGCDVGLTHGVHMGVCDTHGGGAGEHTGGGGGGGGGGHCIAGSGGGGGGDGHAGHGATVTTVTVTSRTSVVGAGDPVGHGLPDGASASPSSSSRSDAARSSVP
jgi:hypothetical protein